MKSSNRFSVALHILVHLVEAKAQPVTSEHLAACLRTNPVVIRRTMAALREAGLVSSSKGHGGGWLLLAKPEQLNLADIYDALGSPDLFTFNPSAGHPECAIEITINLMLGETFDEAKALLIKRFKRITLTDLSADFYATRSKRHHE